MLMTLHIVFSVLLLTHKNHLYVLDKNLHCFLSDELFSLASFMAVLLCEGLNSDPVKLAIHLFAS